MAKKIGDILIEKNLITSNQLKVAFAHQKITGELLGDVLVKLGFISSKERSIAVAEQAGLEFLDLENYVIPESPLRLVPKNVAEKAQFIPLGIEEGRLAIGITKAGNILAVDIATRIAKKAPKIYMVDPDLFYDSLERAYFFLEDPITQRVEKVVRDVQTTGTPAGDDIISLVDLLLLDAIRKHGTDIHITPHEYAINVFYRIDGVLQHQYCLPRATFSGIVSRIKILSQLDIAETRLPQDGALTFKFLNKEYEVRVSFVPTIYGQNVVLRILASNVVVLRLETLGFNEQNIREISGLFQKPNGIILITGPTGSGKTTTLYAGLRLINTLEKNVITVEDPVEYRLSLIRQSQVHERIGYDFASAAKTFLRQDPDVILLGEIRDQDSANIAIRASITGHLVLSTLHTNDAVTSIPRLLDLGAERFLVSSSLLAVIAQRLVRLLCPYCKEPYEPSPEERWYIEREGFQAGELFRGRGCVMCNQTGYTGRTVLSEVMTIGDEIRELIYKGSSINTLHEAALRNGMVPIIRDGIMRVLEGKTTFSELRRVLG